MRRMEPTLHIEGGETSLSVRRFAVKEALSEIFTVDVWARSENPDMNLETILGKRTALYVDSAEEEGRLGSGVLPAHRRWGGVCRQVELLEVEATGLSMYHLQIVPALWLLSQGRDLRTFQHLSTPDIVARVLAKWNLEPVWMIDREAYPKLEYKVQYEESDFTFLRRIATEAKITFLFEDVSEEESFAAIPGLSKLVFADALHSTEPRAAPPTPYVDNPNPTDDSEFVTKVQIRREVRPGSYVLRDYDFRNPRLSLVQSATPVPPDDPYEHYHYQPGSFLVEVEKGGGTPIADDRGFARHDPEAGASRVEGLLTAERLPSRVVSFTTNATDLRPGTVFAIGGHPHSELSDTHLWLITEVLGEGEVTGVWATTCRAVSASRPYCPPTTPEKPKISGVQSAFVVGPPGQEIFTDEFGRVKVQFHWDQQGKNDDASSPWIRVGQGWAGTGFGIVTLPRVGQEVLVGFLEGDPELPIVVGRVFNARNVLPYRLPEHKTVSTWRSQSTPNGTGYNEVVFDDAKGKELFGMRSERDYRSLVKRDETSTVGRHRMTLVQGDETIVINGNQTTFVGGDRKRLVQGDEAQNTLGSMLLHVEKDQDVHVMGARREKVGEDSHLTVGGDSRLRVGKNLSATIQGDRLEKVGKCFALEAGDEIHIRAGGALVIEAQDLTLKGPGGFIRIDPGGVTIKGTLVKINSSGGSPGNGSGASPDEPTEPTDVVLEEPEMDDVARTGHGPT